jgi:hypothetical protein
MESIFHNFEASVNLQELTGIDTGRTLHSASACTNIVDHISTEMRKALANEIIRSRSKISIIIDESVTHSKKSTLVIYIQVCLANYGMECLVFFYFYLIELQSVLEDGNFQA